MVITDFLSVITIVAITFAAVSWMLAMSKNVIKRKEKKDAASFLPLAKNTSCWPLLQARQTGKLVAFLPYSVSKTLHLVADRAGSSAATLLLALPGAKARDQQTGNRQAQSCTLANPGH